MQNYRKIYISVNLRLAVRDWTTRHRTLFCTDHTKFAKVMFLGLSVCPQNGGWWWYPSMPCRWYPIIPCRSLWGVSRRPSGLAGGGGLQAHIQGDLQAHTRGVSRPKRVCIPVCTEADPLWMATATGGTHPTGMYSCTLMCWVSSHCKIYL